MKWRGRRLKYDPIAEHSGYKHAPRRRVKLCIENDLMTYRDAAIFLRMNPTTIRVYKHRGIFTGEKMGKIFLLHGASIRAYMEANDPENLRWWLTQKPDILTGPILDEMRASQDDSGV